MIRLQRGLKPTSLNEAPLSEPFVYDERSDDPSPMEEPKGLALADILKNRRRDFGELERAEVTEALFAMSHGKCAYCESAVQQTSYAEIDRFRPALDAMDDAGQVSRRHYWWLAFAWTNLLPSCVACNQSKMNRFPVEGRRRAPVRERRLLLDPTVDNPEDFLIFNNAGYVAAVPDAGYATARGEHTIDTLSLNRLVLVEGRRDAIAFTERSLERVFSADSKLDPSMSFEQLVRPEEEFAMARRQAALRYLDALDRLQDVPRTEMADGLHLSGSVAVAAQVDGKMRENAFAELRERDERFVGLSLDSDETHARSPHVARVSLTDFKGFVDLELDLSETGWTMLVGENGTGKSSVLQAISLALMGDRAAQRLVAAQALDPARLIRNGADRARIELWRVSDLEPLVVEIDETGIRYETTGHEKAILLGFGSARWQPRPGGFEPDNDEHVRVHNLYNPFVPLGDAEKWILALDHRSRRYKAATDTLHRLLDIDESFAFRQHQGRLCIARPGEKRSAWRTIDQLSDGYQTVLAMAAAIAAPLMSKFGHILELAEGVVLVDELDAHLHPLWKLRIVNDLRAAFPASQFITTSHDPLCLHGLAAKEVVVLEHRDGRVKPRVSTISPERLTAEQLLTSSLFGLPTTQPERHTKLNNYYELVARPNKTDDELHELEGLRASVGSIPTGENPVEQAIVSIGLKMATAEGPTPIDTGEDLVAPGDFDRLRQAFGLAGDDDTDGLS